MLFSSQAKGQKKTWKLIFFITETKTTVLLFFQTDKLCSFNTELENKRFILRVIYNISGGPDGPYLYGL